MFHGYKSLLHTQEVFQWQMALAISMKTMDYEILVPRNLLNIPKTLMHIFLLITHFLLNQFSFFFIIIKD